jgi:hypothetical protein
MSEELKKKLFNYEVSPPESTWANIVNALHEEVNAEFPHKLYEAEITPPGEAWNNIVSELEPVENEEYAAKLYHLEVSPPTDAWRISGALDGKSLQQSPREEKFLRSYDMR